LWAAGAVGGGVSPLDFARRRLSSYPVSRVHRTRVEREAAQRPSKGRLFNARYEIPDTAVGGDRRATGDEIRPGEKGRARREAAGCRLEGNGSALLRFYAFTFARATGDEARATKSGREKPWGRGQGGSLLLGCGCV